MNNFVITIKRFMMNKNTVTILGVILAVVILNVGYQYRVQQAIRPIRMPYAKETIQPRTKITEDMIGYVDVPPARLAGRVIRYASLILDRYSNVNTIIPEGSLFYEDTIIPFNELPDASIISVPKDLVPFNLKVNMDKTYGNSIFPGNFIDIYFKGFDENEQLMVGKLVSNIRIIAVKDRNGRHVFENTQEDREPATFIFAVPGDIHLLLRKATFLTDYSVELIPVPHGGVLEEEPGVVELSSSTIQDFILRNAPIILE